MSSGRAVQRGSGSSPDTELGRILAASMRDTSLSVIITDADARIIYANPAFERMSGYCADEIVGLRPCVLSSGLQSTEFYDRLWKTIMAGEAWEGELVNRRKNGELYPAELTITPIRDARGRILHYLGCHRDLTGERVTRQRLDETVQRLDRVNQELDDLIANVDEVLRGPLRALRCAAEAIARNATGSPDQLAEHAVRMRDFVANLHGRVGDLLHLYRIGRERAPAERVDLDGVMREVHAELAITLRRRKARLRIGPLGDAPGVGPLVREMLMSLVLSALGRCRDAPDIRVQRIEPSPHVELVVMDNAPAFTAYERRRMFLPFFPDRRRSGPGIELAIARKVAELHGGKLWIEDGVRGGTCLHVALPAADTAAAPARGEHPAGIFEPSPRPAAIAVGGEPLTILLVEGTPLAAELVAAAVARLGLDRATLQVVPSAAEGLALLASVRFDVALVGTELADGDGMNLLVEARRLHSAVPVVIVSGCGDPRHAVVAMQLGAADYLTYDDVPDLLRRVVLSVVERVRGHRQVEEMRADLIGTVTHDLKNPLSNVLSYADLLLERPGDLSAEHQRVAMRIRENCTFMFDLIGDILDMRRIEAGCMKLYAKTEDLGEMVRMAVERYALAAESKGIRVQVDLPDRPLPVTLDRNKINQVLNNLISNALKFSPRDGVVCVGAHAANGRVEVCVEDRGQGIEPAEVELLFKKFSRTSVRPTAGEKSTGLGLYIVKELVRLHGGTIDVRTTPGQGSTFRFGLPAADPA